MATVKQSSFDHIAQIIAEADGKPPVRAGGMEAKIEQEMQGQMNEIFFSQVPVLVEGLEDIAYIATYMELFDYMDEFRSLGGHLIQCQGKSHLIQAAAICHALCLPCFLIFDADGDTPADTPEKTTGKRKQHERENLTLMKLMGLLSPEPFPSDIYIDAVMNVWPTKIGDVVVGEIGEGEWKNYEDIVRKKYGNYSADMGKNSLFIAYCLLEGWKANVYSGSMKLLCERILDHVRTCVGQSETLSISAATEVMPVAEC